MSPPQYDQVLNRLVLESSDGFLERTDFIYDANRAKTQDQVSRHGTSIYTEDYSFDDKGNLTRKEDRSGVVISFSYDPIFSIPTRTLKSFTSKGISTVRQEYKSTQTLNDEGQVTDSSFPVKVWQTLSIDKWNDDGAGHWLSAPDSTESVKHQSWRVFNTDGTLWMEVDSAGHLVEHYYNAIGDEIETVHPDMRININYATDFILSESDIDLSQKAVHVTAIQGDGLGHVEKEIEYKNGTPYAVKKMTYDAQGRMIALTNPEGRRVIEKRDWSDNLRNKNQRFNS